jgi:hypothetical protein
VGLHGGDGGQENGGAGDICGAHGGGGIEPTGDHPSHGAASVITTSLVITTAAIMRVLAFAAMSTITGITSAAN